MSVFLNQEIEQTASDVSKYCDSLEKALYEQYKVAYCLTKSNNFYGGSADAYKNYIQQVSIYFINIFLNTVDEINQAMLNINQIIHTYESDGKGIVDQNTIEDTARKLSDKKQKFGTLMDEIWSIDSEATAYISVTSPSYESVDEDFGTVQKNLSKIQDDFIQMNNQALQKASALLDHVNKLISNIGTVNNDYHYAGNKRINFDKLKQITSEQWYQPENDKVLSKMLKIDPFSYQTGRVAVKEGQWAQGFSPDIYAYAGGSILSGSYDIKRENGTAALNASGALASGNFNIQYTDWARLSTAAYVLGGNINAKAGWSDKYKGFKVEGEGSVAKAVGSLKVGPDNFNGYLEGNAEFCSANGYAVAELQDKDDFDIGFSGEATVAKAEGLFGFSFLKAQTTQKVNGKKQETDLFGIHGSVETSGGGSIGAGISSKNIFDSSIIDVNATTIKINACLGIGGSVDLTIPTLLFG